MDLRRGVQLAVDAIVQFLRENSRVITTSEEIAQVIDFTLVQYYYVKCTIIVVRYLIGTGLHFYLL